MPPHRHSQRQLRAGISRAGRFDQGVAKFTPSRAKRRWKRCWGWRVEKALGQARLALASSQGLDRSYHSSHFWRYNPAAGVRGGAETWRAWLRSWTACHPQRTTTPLHASRITHHAPHTTHHAPHTHSTRTTHYSPITRHCTPNATHHPPHPRTNRQTPHTTHHTPRHHAPPTTRTATIAINDGNHCLRSQLARLKFRGFAVLSSSSPGVAQKATVKSPCLVAGPSPQRQRQKIFARPGMPTERGGGVPKHIREHLPEDLCDLPAELIYATDLPAHEFELSAPARRAQDAQDRVSDTIWFHFDRLSLPWPGEAVDASREVDEGYRRARQMQADAMKWVQENRCPTPAPSSSSSASSSSSSGEEAGEEADEEADEEAGEEADEEADEEAGRRSGRGSSSDESYLWPVDDDGRMAVDESGEAAGEADPQNHPAP